MNEINHLRRIWEAAEASKASDKEAGEKEIINTKGESSASRLNKRDLIAAKIAYQKKRSGAYKATIASDEMELSKVRKSFGLPGVKIDDLSILRAKEGLSGTKSAEHSLRNQLGTLEGQERVFDKARVVDTGLREKEQTLYNVLKDRYSGQGKEISDNASPEERYKILFGNEQLNEQELQQLNKLSDDEAIELDELKYQTFVKGLKYPQNHKAIEYWRSLPPTPLSKKAGSASYWNNNM